MTHVPRSAPDYQQELAFLLDRVNFEKSTDRPYNEQNYRLNRMRRLLELLGTPQTAAPVVHVAGTKGKGSVSAFIANAMTASGMRTGLYSSPHLLHLEERWQIDGQPVSPAEVASGIQAMRPAVQELSQSEFGAPTFFEMTTALGWYLFRQHATDINVVEVGLGGRLDSTNVCDPALTVITSISYDHQQQLGSTLALIAGEKAGIIKPRVPVISGAIHPEAATVIRAVAKERGAPMRELHRDFGAERRWIDGQHALHYRSAVTEAATFPVRMLGSHQIINASLACAAIEELRNQGRVIPESAWRTSLAATQLPARVEVRHTSPLFVLDTAHNVASTQALLQTLKDHFQVEHRILVFSASRDKEYRQMLSDLGSYFHRILLTQFQTNPRAVPYEQLGEVSRELFDAETHPWLRCEVLPTPKQAMARAVEVASPDSMICACGSFFLAAELMGMDEGKPT